MFKVYGETEDEPVLLALKQNGCHVELVVVDRNGYQETGGSILYIDGDGYGHRYHNVSDRFGFKLDDKGRVEFE